MKKYDIVSAQKLTRELSNNEIEFLSSEYTRCTDIFTFHHITCDHFFERTFNEYLENPTCPKCAKQAGNDKKAASHEDFIAKVYNLVQDEYIVLSKYRRHTDIITFKHNVCGTVFQTSVRSFVYDGHRCPSCCKIKMLMGAQKAARNKFIKAKEKFYTNIADKFILIEGSEYSGPEIPVKLQCCHCNAILTVTPHYLQRIHYKCTRCSQKRRYDVRPTGLISLNEKRIQEALDTRGIPYKKQYVYNDCRDVNMLPFDFAILNPDNSVKCLIEYDGEQHFRPIKHFGGEVRFKTQQTHDLIKNEYCIRHNIALYRIAYNQNLNEELNKILIMIQKE